MDMNLLDLIGNTPLVELKRINPNPSVKILAKLEAQNPGGSIKDRVAAAMIRAAEESGELTPDKTIIEATSGNTGVGLAMVAAVKGYRIKLLMPETASEERKMIMRAYGAGIELTAGHLGTDGAIELAYRLAREEPDKYVLMDQFNNPASIEAHYMGTGLEIWNQTEGEVTHAVAALGTSGTIMGIAKRLHEMNPAVHVAAVEPYAGHKIQGLKNMLESYPPGIYNKKWLDEILHVEDETAFEMCRTLARTEGIFAGMSSGAAVAGALQLAERLETGTIVVIIPDSGERYLSTHLYRPRQAGTMSLFDVASAGLKPLNGTAGLGVYTMGPSLDNPDSIDSWRRLVTLDTLARFLGSRGVEVRAAAGLADMDDRTLAGARDAGTDREAFTASMLNRIKDRAAAMGIGESVLFPLATDGSDQALDLCRKLMGKGLAYEKLRSVYFDVFRDKRYGDIGARDLEKVTAGRTVDLDAYVKDNPLDFTLLKRASLQDLKRGEVMETQWGNVRPSWFLQHAVAALTGLDRIDVFVGSESHRFPHLDNLRAIWSVAGREVQAWLVGKMATDCTDETLAEVIDAMGSPRAARLWLLSVDYAKPLCASAENLAMWTRNWQRIQETAATLTLAADSSSGDVSPDAEQAVFDLKTAFLEAMEQNMTMHKFWPALFSFCKKVNAWAAEGSLTGAAAAACLKRLRAVDSVLGIVDRTQLPVPLTDLPAEVQDMVAERQKARQAKDFAASDALRDKLLAAGYRIEDAPKAPRLFKA